MLGQPGSTYFQRTLKELNDNLLLLLVEEPAQVGRPGPHEEVKDDVMHLDEFPVADDDQMEDRESRELAASSKVLMDIYGPKIKLDIAWYFESPVVMKEDQIGSIADVFD
jgi:hypothetical protein